MKVGYTEFSYGYAFTENLTRSSANAPTGAPVFPNLVQEAQLGYDVNINLPGKPLFFQFKLPELMCRGTAFELTKYHCPGITVPFFRIALMRRDLSDQHKCLLALEQKHPNAVFYVAPFIEGIDQFNQLYNNAKVHENSIYLLPGSIGKLPDDLAHTVAYKSGMKAAYFCSDLKPIKAFVFEDVQKLTMSRLDTKMPISETAKEIREDLLSFATPAMRDVVYNVDQRVRTRQAMSIGVAASSSEQVQTITDILVAREIARISLGLDLVFAQPV